MTSNVVIAIVLIVIAAAAYFINLFSGKEEDSVSNTLILTGISLIASGIPAISDAVVDCIFQLLSLQSPENEDGYLFRAIIGLALVVLGLALKVNLKKRIYVLNMYGIAAQKDIDEPKALADLKLAEHKVKEQIIVLFSFLMVEQLLIQHQIKLFASKLKTQQQSSLQRQQNRKKPILREWLLYHIPFMLVLFLKLLK